MIAAWMLYGILTTAIVALAALAVERICRMRRWATRWVWVAAMAAPLVLALVPQPSEVSPEPVAAAVGRGAEPSMAHTDASRASWSVLPRIELARRARSLPGAAGFNELLLLAWVSASGVFAAVLVVSAQRLRRRALRWKRSTVAGADVLVAEGVGPAVFGIVRPRIVAPSWLLDADERTQRATIAHEHEHIAARDPQLLAIALFLLVLVPWNLPMWSLWRRLRLAIEVDCDARVLRSGEEAVGYGTALLDVAARRMQTPLLSPAMHDSTRAMEQRIRLLFADRPAWPRSVAVALMLSAATLTVAAAQISPPNGSGASSPAARGGSIARFDPVRAALGRELVHAAQGEDFDTAAALIEAGADVNRVAPGDGTPLIIAARRGNLRLVNLLLQNGALPDLGCPGDGNPLIMAAATGRMEIAAALVDRGADVNGVVIGDETPLINAAREGRLQLVEYLVEQGADVNLSAPADHSFGAEIRSPLSEAEKHNRSDVVRYLRGKGAV